jgi:hypothetical protein
METLWKPWQWARSSNQSALANARAGAIELGSRRLERAEVDLFLAEHRDVRAAAGHTTHRPA